MGSQVMGSLVQTRVRCRKASPVFYSIYRPHTKIFSITMVATKHQVIMALALLTLSLNIFTSVDGVCLNCESPWGEYCCKTSWNGECCEYPGPWDDLEFEGDAHVAKSPLANFIKEKEAKIPAAKEKAKSPPAEVKRRQLSEDQFL